jgi:hypothetical protein
LVCPQFARWPRVLLCPQRFSFALARVRLPLDVQVEHVHDIGDHRLAHCRVVVWPRSPSIYHHNNHHKTANQSSSCCFLSSIAESVMPRTTAAVAAATTTTTTTTTTTATAAHAEVMFTATTSQRLGLRVGSRVRVFPPWLVVRFVRFVRFERVRARGAAWRGLRCCGLRTTTFTWRVRRGVLFGVWWWWWWWWRVVVSCEPGTAHRASFDRRNARAHKKQQSRTYIHT